MADHPARKSENEERADRLEVAAVDSANQTLKALLLLNGAACISILAFLSSVASRPEGSAAQAALIQSLLNALIWFSSGAAVAVLASAGAYLSNSFYARGVRAGVSMLDWRIGMVINWIAVVIAFGSLVCFVMGVLTVRSSA